MAHSADAKSQYLFFVRYFFFFRKYVLTFNADCLLRRQFAFNVKTYFFKKTKKKIKMSSAEKVTQHAMRYDASILFTCLNCFLAAIKYSVVR